MKEAIAEKARKKIGRMFPDWDGYRKLTKDYQKLVDEESRFVYALDKILPVWNIVMDGGRSWRQEEITLRKLVDNKREKVAVHPLVYKLWNDLEVYLWEHEEELFGKLS